MTSAASEGGVELSPVAVSGHLADRLRIVTQTSMQLVTGIGVRDNGDPVLVPYADMQFFALAIGEEESTPVYEPLVGLENLAFILASMAGDGARACNQLAQMSGGNLKPDRARMRQAVEYFETAIASMQGCVAELTPFGLHEPEPVD